jgi:hypothetical protein
MEGLDADEERWAILLKKIDLNNDGKVGFLLRRLVRKSLCSI